MDLYYIDGTEPDSPTTPTATSIPFPEVPSGSSEPPSARLKRLGRSVYKDIWNEFYDWDPGYCAEILRTIPQPLPASKRQVARAAKAIVSQLVARDDARWNERVATAERTVARKQAVVMSVTHFSTPSGHRRSVSTRTDVPIPVVTVDTYPSHPKYESCPPISRSVRMDTAHEHTLAFLPYADDVRFPAFEYQAKFQVLEWEIPFDPDVEMIQSEVVRRLRTTHGVDESDINNMKMFKKIRLENNTGLQWEESQRDILRWPGDSRFEATEEAQLPSHAPDPDDLRQRLASNLKTFCPSINCLHSLCETHGLLHANTHLPSGKPTMSGKDLILSEGVPCGPDCFRHIQDFERFMETLPPFPTRSHHTGSLETLSTVLSIAPDLFPCQLAIICLRPCEQVFAQRLQLFPDHTILPVDDDSLMDTDAEESRHIQQRKKAKGRLRFVDEKSCLSYELLKACVHPGPCTSNVCTCHVNKQHCSLMCKCGVKCERQWKPCACTNGKCDPRRCDCAKNGRECIPGICITCDAGGQTGKPCGNTRLQRLASKPVEIKCGSYGLGAFAHQSMGSETFLGTYVGHLLTNDLADHTNKLAKHTSYNYLFEITPNAGDFHLTVIDAAYLGNSTRFLNHGTDGKENVAARPMLVIGEHQIGFFTNRRIKAGEELFINYGDSYWKNMGKEDPKWPSSMDVATMEDE